MQRKKSSVKLWKTPDGKLHVNKPFTHDYKTNKTSPQESIEVMLDDCDFNAALKLIRFHHGRKCHFYFKDLQTNHVYMMQGTEMEDLLFKHTLYQGLICGRWRFFKKGNVLSIGLLEELNELPESDDDSLETNNSTIQIK